MKKKAFTFWQVVLVLAGMALLAAILFPIFGRPRETGHGRNGCQSNLKQIGLGLRQYVQDYNDKYPLVNSGKDGWMDIIQPYIKSTQLFQCPRETTAPTDGPSDYFYNARLSNVAQASLNYVANTIMNGDGVAGTTSNNLNRFPENWRDDHNSPAWRHIAWGSSEYVNAKQPEGSNYSYADGHVKWLRPTSVTNQKAAPNITTFALW